MSNILPQIFEKFKYDLAIYGICPNCNFYYRVNDFEHPQEIVRCYNFCPMCGKILKVDSQEVDVIWEERDISELIKEG